eukprot:COSAG05_NODE_21279_length_273_cov_0.586207_1_plen_43_part_10
MEAKLHHRKNKSNNADTAVFNQQYLRSQSTIKSWSQRRRIELL